MGFRNISIGFFVFFLAQNTGAFAQVQFAEVAAQLGISTQAGECPFSKSEIIARDGDFARHSRHAQEWACLALKRNLELDFENKLAAPSWTNRAFARVGASKAIRGRLAHQTLVPLPYRYDAYVRNDGTTLIRIAIRFDGKQINDTKVKKKVDTLLQNTSRFWTSKSPFPWLKFRFDRVQNDSDAHFTVRFIKPRKAGTFYEWNENWTILRAAHEVGHMMGLLDEYNFLHEFVYDFGQDDQSIGHYECDVGSIMCATEKNSAPLPYHYYLILRRLQN